MELRLLTDSSYAEEFDIAVDELTDQYAAGEISAEEREPVERYFLRSEERRSKLRFASALRAQILETASSAGKQRSHLKAYLAIAASVLIVFGLGYGVWRVFFHQSDVEKGLIALKVAYRERRPVESRISALDYAPFSQTRGSGADNVNKRDLQESELTLLTALRKNPTSAVKHALGEVYLAKGEFDAAINQFEEALKDDPRNPKLLSDLGAAWLEKGKIDRKTTKSDDPTTGKGFEELGRGLENINKALELDSDLLDALFNRALCLQYLTASRAEDAWKKYLEKDSTSRWAEEARNNLKLLEEQKTKTSQTKEQLFHDFLLAYEDHNIDAAWIALSHSRARPGNTVTEALLDDYLKVAGEQKANESAQSLQRLVFAGTVQLEKDEDRLTWDTAGIYQLANTKKRLDLTGARSQMRLANELFNKSEFEAAIELYSLARDAFNHTGDTPEALFAESWIGYSRLRIPQLKESIQLFEYLSGEFESRGYRSLLAQSLHALADAHLSRNEYSKALDYANLGLEVSEQIEDEATAIRCLTIGVSAHLILGDYRQSLDSLGRALRLVSAIPPEPKLTWPLYHDAALDFHFLALPTSALTFEQEALQMAEASGVPLLRSRSWEQLGVIYGQEKKYDKAIESGQKALAEAQNISGELSRKNVEARSLLILGELNRDAGDPRKALDYFDRSLALYKDLNFDAYSYRAHKAKLLSFIALNDDGAASLELTTVLRLFEDNRKTIIQESSRDRFFDAGQDTYDLAIGFADSRGKNAIQALQYAENSRARSLVEMMNTGADVVETKSGAEIKLSTESSSLSVSEIQRNMPAQAQLLEYAVLDNEVLMWVITKAEVRSGRTQVSGEDLEQKVRNFVRLLSAGGHVDRETLLTDAKELRSILIAPIEHFLDANLQLCIVADKSLHYLPFAALASSAGRYLIEDYLLETAPSATVYVKCSKEAQMRGNVANERLLVVGNPRFDRGAFRALPDLPGALKEARGIAGFYSSPTVLVEGEASARRVKLEMTSADVIHLATHAVADERSPLLSKLLLASDGEISHATNKEEGVLRVSEIYQIKFPRTRLVVLSACQTIVEQTYRGEGAIGLARPFLADGVPLVVASLWPVESNATAELMLEFHRNRKKDGMSTAAALQQSQLAMLHNPQSASHGGYGWAAFTVIGGYAAF